jgi:hypothetical protein
MNPARAMIDRCSRIADRLAGETGNEGHFWTFTFDKATHVENPVAVFSHPNTRQGHREGAQRRDWMRVQPPKGQGVLAVQGFAKGRADLEVGVYART